MVIDDSRDPLARRRLAIALVVVLVLLSPVVTGRDSYPVSTYPMYASARGRTTVIDTAYGVRADGTERTLPIEVIAGTDDPLRAASLVRNAVDAGTADQLCRTIAARAPDDVVDVVVVREQHDVVAAASGDNDPLTRAVEGAMFRAGLTPAPAERLAVFRILLGLFVVGYVAVRYPVFWNLGDALRTRFEPVGVLWWMDGPPAAWLIRTLLLGVVASGIAVAVGAAFRWTAPVLAGALLILTTLHSSAGQLLWFENLFTLHVIVLACSPAADALTFPRRSRTVPTPSTRYSWPLQLAVLITVVTYVLAGIAKLRSGGWAWMSGDSLRNHIAFTATRARLLGGQASPLAAPLVRHEWLFAPMTLATMVLELGAPVVLLVRRLRWPWAVAIWTMHVAIAATMFVIFPYPLAFIAFAPLFALERLLNPIRRRRTRSPATAI